MFDIGFWEIVVVGVVALLVIGPKELPVMMRTVGGWMSKTRHFVNAVKTEIEREAYRADEIKRLLAEQAGIVERHKNIDPSQPAVPIIPPIDYTASESAPAPSPVDARIEHTATAPATAPVGQSADPTSKMLS